MPLPVSVRDDIVFGLSVRSATFVRSFVRSSGQILLPRYLTNGLSIIDKTYRIYPFAPTNDLIKFWRYVKVTAGRRGDEGIHVDASRNPSSSF